MTASVPLGHFEKVAEGFGCNGQSVTEIDALSGAFERALTSDRPEIIDVPVEYTPNLMDFMWPEIILHGFLFPERDRLRVAV